MDLLEFEDSACLANNNNDSGSGREGIGWNSFAIIGPLLLSSCLISSYVSDALANKIAGGQLLTESKKCKMYRGRDYNSRGGFFLFLSFAD